MIFDPFSMCRVLNEEGVHYVVLGGFAAISRGSPLSTRDLDVIPDRNLDNLDRLGRALTRMNAKIRIAGDPVVTKIDGSFLANMTHMLNLVTDFGEMDIAFTPAGSAGDYEGWKKNATDETIADSLVVSVASLDDIIDSKKAANRPKDLLALPYLESLRDEIRRQENS
ncbi:MAG: hypothetical protein RLZ37_1092 [Actinomycetota bacterium]|jgi:hypothetical protein